MKTVIACVDFSPVTSEVVKSAIEQAKSIGARLFLLHVVTPIPDKVGDVCESSHGSKKKENVRLHKAHQGLDTLLQPLVGTGLEAMPLLFKGSPADHILTEAAAWKANLIVIGSPNMALAVSDSCGQTAVALLKAAPCPILVVPSPQAVKPGTQ